MKKNTRTAIDFLLATTAISSIALSLHFNSLNNDLEQSHNKLNEKYKDVLLQNEGLQETNNTLESKVKKSSDLLEQSNTEIERLNKETENLHEQVLYDKNKIGELEKKLNSTP